METNTIYEQPIFYMEHPCEGYDFAIFASDLKSAEVGNVFEAENQDRAVNREKTWTESWTVVYKNEHGCAVLYRSTEPDGYDDVHLTWVELH
jgi:hypothetical protein